MFNGTVPQDMRQIVHEAAGSWTDGADIAIGCSGNLTIERTLLGTLAGHNGPSRTFRLHSNDVTAYSCALGWYFAGQPVPFRLREESRELLDWIEPYLDDAASTVAVLMQGTRFLQWVGRVGRYYERMVAAHREQFDRLIEQTVARLESTSLRLASYTAADVRAWLQDVPTDWPTILFPPFFANDYADMFAPLDTHFDWPAPEYGELDEAGKEQLIAAVTDRPNWLLGLHQRWPDLDPYLCAEVQTAQRGVPIHLYSSTTVRRLVRPNLKHAQVPMPKVSRHIDLTAGSRLTLHPIRSLEQFNSLRSQFMSRTINPGKPLQTVAVAVDGHIVGAFAWMPPKHEPHTAYLLSDFPVPWTRHRRLSKLVVMAALSTEARALLQQFVPKQMTHVLTTAYSNNPKSAKYGRGTGMTLHSRTEGVEQTDGIHRYQLEYRAAFGSRSLADTFALWIKKHGHDLREPPC